MRKRSEWEFDTVYHRANVRLIVAVKRRSLVALLDVKLIEVYSRNTHARKFPSSAASDSWAASQVTTSEQQNQSKATTNARIARADSHRNNGCPL